MFTPAKEKSQRTMLLELFEDVTPGEVVSYEDIAEWLGLELDDVKGVQRAVNGAKRSLEVHQSKALEAEPRKGYRVVAPNEHHRLAVMQQRKSRRALVRAKSKVAHVDLSGLTEGERVAITLATTALAAQLDFQRRADLRYANRQQVEEFMAEHKESAERTTEELEKVRARMARLEAKVKAKGEGK